MPTGYTSDLYDGDQSFEDFAMSCARAFGALVTMRDEPAGAPIPEEFEPSSYNRDQAQLAREALARIEAWTDEDAERHAAQMHASQMVAWQREDDVRKARQERYEAMLEQVQAWEPPTPDHEEMRRFMAQQLQQSIDFDCTQWPPPERMDGPTYKAQQLEVEKRRLERAEKANAEEVDRARRRTEWVRALRESLGFAHAS